MRNIFKKSGCKILLLMFCGGTSRGRGPQTVSLLKGRGVGEGGREGGREEAFLAQICLQFSVQILSWTRPLDLASQ